MLSSPQRHFPGELQRIMEWFRDYKIPDGRGANKFGWDGVCQDKAFALSIIQETHQAYVHLKSGARINSEELSLI
jgi:inorganic pyrophosphatase